MRTFYKNPYHEKMVRLVRCMIWGAIKGFSHTNFANSSENFINPVIEGLIRELKYFVDHSDHDVSKDCFEQLQTLTNKLLDTYENYQASLKPAPWAKTEKKNETNIYEVGEWD